MNKVTIKITNALIKIDDYFRKKLYIIFYWINKRQYDIVFEHLNIQHNDKILDIGFGDSYWIFEKRIIKNSIRPIETGGIKITKNGILRFILQEINRSVFVEENKFSKIYTVNSLFFLNNSENFFPEIIRILKPDGIFINIITIGKYIDKILYKKYGYKKYNFEEIKKVTEKYGMKIIKTIEIKKNKSYCIISKNNGVREYGT